MHCMFIVCNASLSMCSTAFSGPFWRRFVLATLGVVAFYKFAPAPGEDNRLTAALAESSRPAEFWEKLTVKHLLQTVEVSDGALLEATTGRTAECLVVWCGARRKSLGSWACIRAPRRSAHGAARGLSKRELIAS